MKAGWIGNEFQHGPDELPVNMVGSLVNRQQFIVALADRREFTRMDGESRFHDRAEN